MCNTFLSFYHIFQQILHIKNVFPISSLKPSRSLILITERVSKYFILRVTSLNTIKNIQIYHIHFAVNFLSRAALVLCFEWMFLLILSSTDAVCDEE